MVERLKEQPFALVSISGDEKKETLTDFLAKEKMPWTHWWNGSQGGVLEEWDVRHYRQSIFSTRRASYATKNFAAKSSKKR